MFSLSPHRLKVALPLAAAAFSIVNLAHAQDAAWSGNMAKNPGFEEDFVNLRAEPHVISFKGDWFYNQKDNVPDNWNFAGTGTWTWNENAARGGAHSLKLSEGQSASQNYSGAIYNSGGGAWGGAPPVAIKLSRPERMAQPWRATVWTRGGGTLRVGDVSATAPSTPGWQLLQLEVPADKAPQDGSMTITLVGPGEFDDLSVQEHLAATPNLMPNAGFEAIMKGGYPLGWSTQKKFDWIGPTYYVWTDWMHFQNENRGAVTTDSLIAKSGSRSLRFDVYPGDEKFVESGLINLNQNASHVIEISAYVRADRIKLFDIRAVDNDGVNLPSAYPLQPEYNTGGTALFGNGTFGWRYVRKYFAMPFDAPVKGIRVRLAARGFNADTLDDSGTRAYACQTGTVWWDDLRVVERTSTPEELRARGVTAAVSLQTTPQISDASLDLGERLFGANRLSLDFKNNGEAAGFQLKLTRTLPGVAAQTTESEKLFFRSGVSGVLQAAYSIPKLAGDLKEQGHLQVQLLRDGKVLTDTTYAFNTWPVVVDMDISRHYNLPEENPVTSSFNLGVSSQTLAQTKTLEIELVRISDRASLGKQTISNLPAAFAQTRAALPKSQKESYEFNLPTPAWWADQTNLIVTKLDLSRLKVWPQNNPTRDTQVVVRGLDASGKILFSDVSDGVCRVDAPPRQAAIQSVKVRQDGAVLINDQPRYLFGATHQHQRLEHTPAIIAQLGLMGHRLTQGDLNRFEALREMWVKMNLYALQMKPVEKGGGGDFYLELSPEQKKSLEDFVRSGGMESIVSINTGGWESQIPDTPEARAKHQVVNDYIRGLTNRPIAWSSSGAYNAWNISSLPYYDIVHAETEMWGPMDFNTIYSPAVKRAKSTPSTWVYLPQLYDNTPYERYRFETYENIIRGSSGVSMIQGIGDATFNRGLAGELRYLEAPLNSLDKAPEVRITPGISHKVTRYNGKTYVLATNAGPIIMGNWKWDKANKFSGAASHEGDSVNRLWGRPAGMRLHGFRGLPMPELVQAGDKIVQYVWLDPKEKPDWAMFAVRGDGKFSHAGVLGDFDFQKFREEYGNVFLFSELEHSVWHEINYVMDEPTYQRAVVTMGKEWADSMKKSADAGRATVDKKIYQAEHFHRLNTPQTPGKWQRLEMSAEELGLVGTLVDGFAYMTKNGRALWDYSALERGGKVVRVFNEDSAGIDRSLLKNVRIEIPGLKAGAKVKALFENRTLTAQNGGFSDDFEGVDTYGYEAGAVAGDMFGFVKDDNRELPRMLPSGYGYTYGPTAVHIYEIEE